MCLQLGIPIDDPRPQDDNSIYKLLLHHGFQDSLPVGFIMVLVEVLVSSRCSHAVRNLVNVALVALCSNGAIRLHVMKIALRAATVRLNNMDESDALKRERRAACHLVHFTFSVHRETTMQFMMHADDRMTVLDCVHSMLHSEDPPLIDQGQHIVTMLDRIQAIDEAVKRELLPNPQS